MQVDASVKELEQVVQQYHKALDVLVVAGITTMT